MWNLNPKNCQASFVTKTVVWVISQWTIWVTLSCVDSGRLPAAQSPATQETSRERAANSAESVDDDRRADSQWEFGVEVGSSGGADNVTVVFPVPQEWPDQTVQWGESKIVPAASRVTEDKIDGVTLVTVQWRSIAAGETASIRIPAQISKRFERVPEARDSFQFPPRVPSKLKIFLQPSPYIESSHRRIKALAAELPIDSNRSPWQQVEQIYDWVRDNIEYRFDTKIKTCLDAIDDGYGDCEEMSSLFIALCRARGIPARAVWIPDHTYAEFYLEDAQGQGTWYPCQLAGTRQFGEMLEPKPVLQKGDKFKIPGNSQPLRYAQPTLVAERTQGPLTLKWIAQELKNSDR